MNGPVPTLQARLEQVAVRQRRLQLACKLAACWAGAALVGLIFLIVERQSGWASSLALPITALIGVIGAVVILMRQAKTTPDYHALAAQIQARYGDLEGRLITAIQQQPVPGADLNFLQDRLLHETLLHSHQHDWAEAIPSSIISFARGVHLVALLLFGLTLWQLRSTISHGILTRMPLARITVTPGDAIIERGSSLVVLARFGKTLPPVVELVVGQTPETSRRIPLVKSLADPMFGGSVPEVTTNFVYHIEYGGERTRDYAVKVFEYPRLERANADLTPPDYTSQPAKHIENTRRVSAVEGSRLEFELHFNKPVVSAQLVSKEKDKDRTSVVILQIQTNRPMASLKKFVLETSKSYELRLLDAEGRTNKAPAQFVFEALKNRTPELRLASPRGDIRPSSLEEISFEGTVWDDFGVRAYGLAFTRPGEETKLIELGRDVPANEKRPFKHLFRLEDLHVEADQLLSWFVWADDIGPDGQLRRTSGDMFFAEIRPFEEVFREGDSMDGQSQQNGQGGQQGNQSAKLGELQKQIISATWRLQREHKASPGKVPPSPAKAPSQPAQQEKAPTSSRNQVPVRQFLARPVVFGRADSTEPAQQSDNSGEKDSSAGKPKIVRPSTKSPPSSPSYQEDVIVVLDSQSQVLDQAQTAAQRQDDARTSALWNAALKAMEKAITKLNQATNSPAALPEALAAEQAAYEAFLKVQQHEYQVTRNQNRNQNGGGRGQQMQRQLEQMDLTKSENRYETQRQAQSPQTTERREQLQVQNRLQELARRQQDLNDRLKELQTALQEASTEQEREEIRRRLKRLQEEEQQMLADVDELRQRMDRPENQSQMSDERRQLDQTREDVQRAADSASQGSPSQALASGTRAQRQLQQLRDQVRKENSNQFADDVREMRNEARELANQQQEILKKMQPGKSGERKSLSDSPDRKEALEQLSRQKQRLTNLVDRAGQVSQQAEDPEPLLSRQLYDTVRKFSQDTSKDFQEAQDELLRRGLMPRDLYEKLKDKSAEPGPGLLDLTSELLRQDFLPQATDAGQRAARSFQELQRGVERAAQGVLGDDTESLRLAQQQLDQITDELEREMARAGTGQSANGSATNLARARNAARSGSQQAGTGSENQKRESQKPDQETASAIGDESPKDSATNAGPSGKEQQNASPDINSRNARSGRNSSSANETAANDARNDGTDFDQILNRQAPYDAGPITGGDFGPWSDRLRDVEEMIEFPDLRNRVAVARERARLFRQEYKRDLKKPDWAVVQLQVMKPLAEVRDRIADELARRESADALVPVDRDPVPNRYSDLVRRYYEGLGKPQ